MHTMMNYDIIGVHSPPPPPKILGPPLDLAPHRIYFFAQVPPNYFGLKFLGPSLPKIRGAYYGRE